MDKKTIQPRQGSGPIIAALIAQEGGGDMAQGSPLSVDALRYVIAADLLAQRETLLQRLASVDKTLVALGHKVATPRRFRAGGEQARESGGG